jgi:LacI family transcriptional regulator
MLVFAPPLVKTQVTPTSGRFASQETTKLAEIPVEYQQTHGYSSKMRPNLRQDRRYESRAGKGMKRSHFITGIPQVALLLETSTQYGRGLLRGIVRYARLHGPWSLYVAPGHLEQVLPKAKSWSGTGIIARIHSPAMAKILRATRLPFVASSLDESRSSRRGDKVGEIRTNSAAIAQMAAAHLVEQGLRHFAFCGFAGCAWSMRREEAFSQYLRDRGFRCQAHRIELANWMHWPNWIEKWVYEQPVLVNWLKSLPKPVGLMACNDICGREVL